MPSQKVLLNLLPPPPPPPPITFDARACPGYDLIENAAVEDDIKKELHKAHERIHCAAKYFYKLIEQGDIDNLYDIYWNIEYLGILIITTVALHKLKDQNEFYKTFFEGHSIPMLFVDIDTYSIVDANKAALMFYGYTKEEITSLKNWDINILGEEKMKELVHKAKHKELNFFKFKHRLKSGEIRDVEVYSSPVRLNGKTYLLSIINDITKEERTRRVLEIFKEIENLGITSDNEDIFFEKLLDVLEKEDMFKDVCILIRHKGTDDTISSSKTRLEDIGESLSSYIIHILKNGDTYGSIRLYSKKENYFDEYQEILLNLKDKIEHTLNTIELKKKLDYQNKLVKSIIQNTKIGVLVFDMDGVYYANDYFFELLGYDFDELKALTIFDILSPIHVKDLIDAFANKMPILSQEFHVFKKDNKILFVKGTLDFIRNPENKDNAVFTFVDITKEKELSELLLKQSIEDTLTGIYNRRYLKDKLERHVNLAKRYERPLSVIMFDIDFFKHINDTFGHDVGDKVLIAISKVVSENIRNTDIFARYGGEEFIIVAPETTKEDAKILAEKLRSLIRNLHFEEGINVTCSFGVVSLEKPDTKETLLKRVDNALYEAKRTGRNRVVVL
ncbi:sensor domain-containing diguanylate cyclase [Hydrogenobaculum sp. Y04AAS1]|uniref:sensor domain-containing diguanylate cyclase n=1 Tax=Hydrogenobaculum sp. (strain Y04AAS1) TaxID=380749 RepID=UPI0030803058